MLNPPPHSVIHNPHLAYRPDIDGLRSIAILAVVIFHAFPNVLRGGFIGVDIFFVISGYLITGIILKAQSGEGFSLLDFYSRRIKRIFPALIVVLVFCLIAGWFVLLANEYKILGKHVAAGAAYLSNIILMNEAGYFDVASELKPLLHLWSLGIEEQFYLIWPLLLILTLRWNLNPLAVIVLTLAFSFLLNVANIEQHPTKVFYLPFSRSWELLMGAALAYLNLYQRHRFDRLAGKILLRNPQRTDTDLANVFAITGFLLILIALFGLNQNKIFPGWWALLPTFGAALLIAAGEKAWFNQRILSSKFAVYIGLISYPLYLWHWSLLSFVRIVENGTPHIFIRCGAVFLSLLFAWATYWSIEKHLRHRQHWGVTVGLFVSLLVVGGIGYSVYQQGGYLVRHPQKEAMARNLGTATWTTQGWNWQANCAAKFGTEFNYCKITDNSISPTMLLLGDSTANHFYPGLAKLYSGKQQSLLNLGQGGCPPLYGIKVSIAGTDHACEAPVKKALEYAIETPSVHTIMLSMIGNAYVTGGWLWEGKQTDVQISYPQAPTLNKPLEILDAALRQTLQRLLSTGKEVVFIISPPMLDFDPASCVDARPWRITPAKIKSPCASPRKAIEARNDAFRAMVIKVLQAFPQVKIWDSVQALCDEKYCWAMQDGVLLYRDEVHLNETGSNWLANRLAVQHAQKTSRQ